MSHNPIILALDDELSARETVQALLHADGYRLDLATNGLEALERLKRGPVDLVLSDVMMPGMDGLELCRQIKAHPVWRFIPVILVTALDGQDDMVRGLEAGADDFLTKPIERVVLRARLRAMLRVRQNYGHLQAIVPDLDALVRVRRQRMIDEAGLTEREREVLDLLLLGRTHEDIALALGMVARTAKFHQANILEKLGAESRLDLARLFL